MLQQRLRGLRALRWARSELKLALKMNEAYHDAGPLRVLGRLAHKAPRLFGGSVAPGGVAPGVRRIVLSDGLNAEEAADADRDDAEPTGDETRLLPP